MAILIDLVADPSLHDYLIAANDGCDGRYRQAVDYLKARFDRPRELHQIYWWSPTRSLSNMQVK